MALTLSHQSALDAIRTLRATESNVQEMDPAPLAQPSPWIGRYWTARNFEPSLWRWSRPERNRHLHVAVPRRRGRVRMANVDVHSVWGDLPANSALWIDETSRIVCPELLFLQMSETLPFPMLVQLGYELCGHYTRWADEPRNGHITDCVAAATSVAQIGHYLSSIKGMPGVNTARKALGYVCDHALSAPEAALAMVYSLPPSEAGYGMGPVTLNERVRLGDDDNWTSVRSRFPDLMFSFAPVGINYDGGGHLDLKGLVDAAQQVMEADAEALAETRQALDEKLAEVRAKVVDDNMRNRQLASQGRIVFPVTKEDVCDRKHLDDLTKQILGCAHATFGVDTSEFVRTLDDSSQKADRAALIASIFPVAGATRSSYGTM